MDNSVALNTRSVFPSSLFLPQTFSIPPPVMVNFVCQLDGAMGAQGFGQKGFWVVSVRVFSR